MDTITRSDLVKEYLERGFDDVMCFADYMEARKEAVTVIDEEQP